MSRRIVEIVFFAARKVQRQYFEQVSRQIDCTSRVAWYKAIWLPGISGLTVLKDADIGTIIRLKVREKQSASQKKHTALYWHIYFAIRWLGAAYLFLLYYRYLRCHSSVYVAVWNGNKLRQSLVVRAAQLLGRQPIYFENGLLPNTTTLDFKGVNAYNSVPRERAFFDALQFDPKLTLPTQLVERKPEHSQDNSNTTTSLPARFIFIPFQVNSDSQITIHSPWLCNMRQLFETIAKLLPQLADQDIGFVFKQHPSCPSRYDDLIANNPAPSRLMFANNANTQQLIEAAEAVITINSTVGLESLLLNKKVITLGNAFYNIDGLTLHVNNSDELISALNRLNNWQPDVELRKNFLLYLQYEYAIPDAWTQPTQAHWQALNQRLHCQTSHQTQDEERALFLVSTPLNLFIASGVALHEHADQQCELVFIDQGNIDNNIYIETAQQQWPSSPFKTIHVLPPRARDVRQKLRNRRAGFQQLRTIIQQLKPTLIYTGNDRRIEFQFAMHIAQQLGYTTQGVYLDDGTFTYLGRENRGAQDTWIDNTLKKLTYGNWWRQPPTVGASSWIDDAYVAFPELVHPLLQQKQLHGLEATLFQDPALRELSNNLLTKAEAQIEQLQTLDVLFTLPHASLIENKSQYQQAMHKLLHSLTNEGKHIGVKYHPRQQGSDPFELTTIDNVHLIPAPIGFEALLPVLNKPIIIGDVSTTLLSSKWLRPDLKVISLSTHTAKQNPALWTLFNKLEIPIAQNQDELLQLIQHH